VTRAVGAAAVLAGVSIDTPSPYDKVGLLKPRARSDSGFPLVGDEHDRCTAIPSGPMQSLGLALTLQ